MKKVTRENCFCGANVLSKKMEQHQKTPKHFQAVGLMDADNKDRI